MDFTWQYYICRKFLSSSIVEFDGEGSMEGGNCGFVPSSLARFIEECSWKKPPRRDGSFGLFCSARFQERKRHKCKQRHMMHAGPPNGFSELGTGGSVLGIYMGIMYI
jgi:hypothetical protein